MDTQEKKPAPPPANQPADYASQEGNDKAPGEEQGKKEEVTPNDLKGKKVDANPDDPKDEPLPRP